MRQQRYANTTSQQQPRRWADRQQQQCSGGADYNLLPVASVAPQVSAGFAVQPFPATRELRLVGERTPLQAG